MLTIINTTIVAIISAIIGYFFSIWKTRNRPWISLLGFDGEIRKSDEDIEIPEGLSQLYGKTLVCDLMQPGKTKLGGLLERYAYVQEWLDLNKSTYTILESGVEELKSATNKEETARAIWMLLRRTDINSVLEQFTYKNVIRIPRYDQELEIIVPFVKVDEDDGCFLFNFIDCPLKFGYNFNRMPFNQEILLSIAELVGRLEKDKLIEVFESFGKALKQQLQINDQISKETRSMIEDYSRWMVYFNIINYGPTPFLLFADSATLYITGQHIKPYRLDCYVLQQTEDGPQFLSGAHCIESGTTTTNLMLCTKERQGDIEGGRILRSAYEKGKPEAYIELQILGREIPIKRKIKSTKLAFSGT